MHCWEGVRLSLDPEQDSKVVDNCVYKDDGRNDFNLPTLIGVSL